jgi:hypothetical protein
MQLIAAESGLLTSMSAFRVRNARRQRLRRGYGPHCRTVLSCFNLATVTRPPHTPIDLYV